MTTRLMSAIAIVGLILAVHSTEVRSQEPEPQQQAEAAAAEESSEKKEEKKWDVNDPPGPHREVAISADEGTWVSLDVSPEGDEIVFDLLGDIYAIPIRGGEAKNLTGGIAWDMQPRYSPDGKRIAFTSDRGGGDNIWVMDRDGSNLRAVSKEKFRLLNSPAWLPDGNYIAARKHFTSARSLGAGEIWLYHVSGGGGLQMTKRPNDQKDLGEPAFSPDARYLYYSQDVTPGGVFEYSKDSNDQIYAIRRLDRETGETETFVGGPGGAIRPTPSPDGKWLAFVRRVRFQSTLYLHHIESGEERPVYNRLERDMQETWAIHGVYPSMAWTPDNRSIVFWAEGKIRRVDVESGRSELIPFQVNDKRKVAETLRFAVDVAPGRFPVKMLRWVQVSPSGDRVVYQALGHLYMRDLPDGQPRRVTSQNDHFEFYPSFSRDGRSLVYTTWDDEELGSMRVVSAQGGQGRVLNGRPGYFVEPVFSPDGKTVVYRRISGSGLTGRTWSRDTGVYSVPAEGGEPLLITKEGILPHFGASSDRVYLMTFGGGKRVLKSIELDGSDEREHVESENATEFRISPDERWIAFTERFNAYISPFTPTGQKISLGPGSQAIPVVKVSRDAGEYLHWSGDSSRLHWALGPELFTRELAQAFDFLPGAPDELPGPPVTGIDIGFQAEADAPGGSIALVGARIISMNGDQVIEDGVVVVNGNRIQAVGSRGQVEIPEEALMMDVSGHTVVPGIIDVHAHGPRGHAEMTPQQNWLDYSTLAFGVTTVHDPSNDTSTIFAASEMARSGMVTSPRIFSTGTILYGATTPFTAEIDSLADARSHLRRMKAAGAFSVKSYNQPRRDQRQQIIAAARELEMMVVPEGGSLIQHNLNMLVDGHTGIEHSIPVSNLYRDGIQLWAGTETGYTPTLVVAYGGIWGEHYWYQHTNVWENERLLTFVPRERIDARSRRRTMAPEEEYNHFDNARVCKELTDAGVSVQLGAHGQREGLGAHWELWMFEQGGMTPHESLRAATLNSAQYLGLDADLGSIEAGKLADLIVLEENPLENIRNSEKIRYTMVNGRIYDARTMNQVGNHPSERAAFYWERDSATTPTGAGSVDQ